VRNTSIFVFSLSILVKYIHCVIFGKDIANLFIVDFFVFMVDRMKITQHLAWASLFVVLSSNPALAENRFQEACKSLITSQSSDLTALEIKKACRDYHRLESLQCLNLAVEAGHVVNEDLIASCLEAPSYFGDMVFQHELEQALDRGALRDFLQRKAENLKKFKDRVAEVIGAGLVSSMAGGVMGILIGILSVAVLKLPGEFFVPAILTCTTGGVIWAFWEAAQARKEQYGKLKRLYERNEEDRKARALILGMSEPETPKYHERDVRNGTDWNLSKDLRTLREIDQRLHVELLDQLNQGLTTSFPEVLERLGQAVEVDLSMSQHGFPVLRSISFAKEYTLQPRLDDDFGYVMSLYRKGKFVEDLVTEA